MIINSTSNDIDSFQMQTGLSFLSILVKHGIMVNTIEKGIFSHDNKFDKLEY